MAAMLTDQDQMSNLYRRPSIDVKTKAHMVCRPGELKRNPHLVTYQLFIMTSTCTIFNFDQPSVYMLQTTLLTFPNFEKYSLRSLSAVLGSHFPTNIFLQTSLRGFALLGSMVLPLSLWSFSSNAFKRNLLIFLHTSTNILMTIQFYEG